MSVPFVFELHDAPHDYWRFTEFGLRHLLSDFHNVQISRRNGFIKSTCSPALRLVYSAKGIDCFIGMIFVSICFLLYPVIALLDHAIASEASTSGFNVMATR
ncbi:hypothetical protein EC9_52610 [Rosistilla ulvae]|uniref:Uncharacterized protein n=2 Tax=Rosistilla ulvae TaxID=1930277 RepID=A0A517M829_9BACT|nr:hypothetical protein EC9_52610 [Rosistilla ulvae]